jgi:hypothetical protein
MPSFVFLPRRRGKIKVGVQEKIVDHPTLPFGEPLPQGEGKGEGEHGTLTSILSQRERR